MTPSDVKIVAENINDFIEVPDGINRLRKAVLALAVSGQLVEQNKKETAKEFLEQIKIERQKLNNDRKKRLKELPSITNEEIPFDIPETWKWVRLGDLFEITSSKRVLEAEWKPSGVPFLRARDLVSAVKTGQLSSDIFISEDHFNEVSAEYGVPNEGDIMVTGVRSIGVPYIVKSGDKFYFKDATILWFKNDFKINSEYIRLVFHSSYMQQLIKDQSAGTTVATYTIKNAQHNLVPLPPVEEQGRIIKKVSSVMKQLDELESQKKERDFVRARLTQSAMQALSSGDSKIAFDQLSELIKTPQDINELEGAILSLAISGKITSVSYDQYLSSLNNTTEGPFKIPLSWQWKTLEDICVRITDGSHNPPKETVAGGYFMLSSKNIGNGFINTVGAREISKSDFEKEDKRTDVQHNDVLLTIVGTIGRCSVVKKDLPHRITLQRSVAVLKPTVDIDPNYLVLCLLSPVTNIYLNLEAKGTAQKGIYLNQLKIVPIPVPPLGEQKRIVKKVEELMVLVSHLKKVVL